MSSRLRIAMAQANLLVGDVEGNAEQIISLADQARDQLGADVVVLPELALTGYPPEDLLLRSSLHARVHRALERIKRAVRGIDVIVGFPQQTARGNYNAAALIRGGETVAVYHKHHLPNYSVFDEKRYFVSGNEACVVDIKGAKIALTVCEDAWSPGPMGVAAAAGAQLIVNINASPYNVHKGAEREHVLRQRIHECGVPILYVNTVGGQDELVFDGDSLVMDAAGQVTQRAPSFQTGLFAADFELIDQRLTPLPGAIAEPLTLEASVYGALVLGVRDYIDKNGFSGVVIGLSGGIDSALTLAIAVDAVGADRVEAVSMPSRYTADMSIEDAREEAETLGVAFSIVPIEAVFGAIQHSLAGEFAGLPADTTEENIQARCRGVILMAISNKKGKMVLTTGNKSEMAVGYATLYGDMAGGFDVLKDVPKTLVYRLANHRNRDVEVIPQRVIERPPSAELAPDQKDEDSLPPYEILDPILEMYVEQDKSIDDIVAAGYERATVSRIAAMVTRNEYKRRQAAPGVRVTRRAFGRDRRYPITSGFAHNGDS